MRREHCKKFLKTYQKDNRDFVYRKGCKASRSANLRSIEHTSRVSNIESDNSQNVGLEDYNNISD